MGSNFANDMQDSTTIYMCLFVSAVSNFLSDLNASPKPFVAL